MALFEDVLLLILLAVALLHVSRRSGIPYPTVMALSGVLVAASPWAPSVEIEPRLALVLFIAPALFDAAYDFPLKALRERWRSLIGLAAVVVVLTTAAVACVGHAVAGMPIMVAVALGAIVAPPDAAAATAVLSHFSLPRRMITLLKGESLFNDAVALLILGAAVSAVGAPQGQYDLLLLVLAAPGGLVIGAASGLAFVRLAPVFAGTLGSRLLEFVTTFGVWIVAERLHLSAILAVVAFAMTIAWLFPQRQSARDRVHSYAVWESAVFVLNVLAFLLMGLQARAVISRMRTEELWFALGFVGLVLLAVVFVRIVWVWGAYSAFRLSEEGKPRAHAEGLVMSWCGMRGVVTLAAAFSLPAAFPSRDLIILSAFGIVLGTLVGQGLTLGPLISGLRVTPDESLDDDIARVRVALCDAALRGLAGYDGAAARGVRACFAADRERAARGQDPRALNEEDHLKRLAITDMRSELVSMRRSGEIDDDVFHVVEEELDRAELAASPPHWLELEEV